MKSELIEPLADRQAARGHRLRERIGIACLLSFTAIAIVMTVALHYYNQPPTKSSDRPEGWKPFIRDALDPPPRQP